MENKPTTAVLMPTYNRPDILEDTLNACLDLYRSYDFDVYVYDSSTDNKSGDIVATLQKRFDNLYYVRLSNFSHLDVKYLAMMQGKYLKKDYKYYYLCGDGNSLTSYSLEKIYPYMEQGVELITFIDEIRQKETLEYENVNDLFNSGFMNIVNGVVLYMLKDILI